MRTTFIETLCRLAETDERLWLLTADLGYSVLERFARSFPDRFVNVGVAEQNMIGLAAGLAHSGKVPFVYSIANFPTFRCLEQIRNDVCYHAANVKIVAVGGGLVYGVQGYTHHGIEDLAIMRALPGMTVIAPGDPVEARLATNAIARCPGPCYLRLGKANEPVVHEKEPLFEIGKAIQIRPGPDLTLISTGGMLPQTVATAQQLAEQGIEAQVLSMPTVKPIDTDAILQAARRTRIIISVEEHSVTGGLGSAIADVLAQAAVPLARLVKFGLPDRVNHHIGSQNYLRALVGNLLTTASALTQGRDAA
jgi:transketolase